LNGKHAKTTKRTNQNNQNMSNTKKPFRLFAQILTCAVLGYATASLYTGCSSTKPPSAFEAKFFDVSTNTRPVVVTVTNVIPVIETRFAVQTVTITNSVGVPVPVYVTNTVTVTNSQAVVATVTNDVPTYSLTPNANAKATAGLAGTLTNLGLPGAGSLTTMAVLGALAAWGGFRTRQYAGKNDALSQTAGVLAQNLQTFQSVVELTPQGKDLAKTAAAYIANHQVQAGVAAQVLDLAAQNVNNEQASLAAQQIHVLANSLSQKP
jgi:hypothetical protein